ncbi:MAG: zinc-dependent metalloprotease [Bacteroidia bacterium]|nr:zinc-dependent metalloprotease [Bacteroidia bacterium]
MTDEFRPTAVSVSIRILIHVFQDDSGNGNFCQGNVDQEGFLNQLTDWVNHRLANLDTLKPTVSSPFIADSRVRIRLDTIYYHRDSRAWDCSAEIDAPYMRDVYVDGDSLLNYQQKYQTLPVFIGANNQVTGGHSRNMGDRGYIAVRGYYENFLRQPLLMAIDECGRNLVHELGHCLGLGHNFTGGPAGDQCDNCDDNGCPVEGTSNNIMDYWPSYGYALSKCQFNQIHFCLNGGRGNISEVVINDSCYRVSGIGYRVSGIGDQVSGIGDRVSGGNTLLIGDTVYMHNDLVIKDGGLLKVTGYLSMPGDTKITVEAGGRLEIDGGTIGNLCGDLWLGIQVSDTSGVRPARVSITQGGTVENARTGFIASGAVETELDKSVFRNCKESLVFIRGSSDSIQINNCTFLITTKLNHYEEGITPGIFVRSEGIPRLDVTGTSFINEPGTFIFDADWMGTGISAYGSSISVDHSEFLNLTTGLYLNSQNPDSKAEVMDNRFTHNRYGIKSCFAGIQWISENRLMLQRFNTGSTIGILLGKPDRFAVNRNIFESVYGGGHMAGIVLKEATFETSPVFNNKFSNLPVAVFMDGTPRIDSVLFQWANNQGTIDNLKLGPQFRNNQFDTVAMQLAVITDSVFGSAIGSPEEVLQEFSVPASRWTPGGFAWYADQMNMVAFHGRNRQVGRQPDHGLYWFMNYPGIGAYRQRWTGEQGYGGLMEYLLKIFAIEGSDGWIFGDDVHDALSRISEVPAAARSAKLAGYWEKYQAEDQTWLRESLASIAGRFVEADSLLTELGTELAQKNLDQWISFHPALSMNDGYPIKPDTVPGFDLPDLSAFRFVRQDQEQLPPPGFIVYPNPAQDYLLIQPQPGYSFGKIWDGYIISADGRYSKWIRIGSWEDQKIVISLLPAGVYFIELFSGNQYLGIGKFVKTTHR